MVRRYLLFTEQDIRDDSAVKSFVLYISRRGKERREFSAKSVEDLAYDVIGSRDDLLPDVGKDVFDTVGPYLIVGHVIRGFIPREDLVRFRGLLEKASENRKD